VFVAVGPHPAVTFLSRRGFRRSLAVAVALVVVLVGFLVAAVVPLVDQADQLTRQLRDIEQTMRDSDTTLGRLNRQFRLEDLCCYRRSSAELCPRPRWPPCSAARLPASGEHPVADRS
jgi:hypothetical protein